MTEKYKKVKKEIAKKQIIKITLWASCLAMFLMWFAFVLATSISAGEMHIFSAGIEPLNEQHFRELTNTGYIPFIENNKIFMKKLLEIKDMNPLCLTYKSELTGWFMFVLFAPFGYILLVGNIASSKRFITPDAIKKTNRKGLEFDYLKQKDIEYLVDEINYNIGKKERPKPDIKEVVRKYEKE